MPRGIPKKRTMFVCTTTFVSAFGDARAGERFADGHEMVKKNPQYFQAIQVDGGEVEAATAAPGETRDAPAVVTEPEPDPEPEPEAKAGLTTESFKKP